MNPKDMSVENKPLTQESIQRYIDDKEEESAYLEFKRGDALLKNKNVKEEIHKDVSAFANSDGGIIIYGIEEKNHVAAGIVPVNGNEITKEWLEQVINTGIKRRIDGLMIEPIRIDDKVEQTVYVVTVPRSANAAHMSSDGHFYKRANFQVVRLDEYEIRDLYNRREQTQLEIAEPVINGQGMVNQNIMNYQIPKLFQYHITIRFDILNKGNSIEKLYKTEILIPSGTYTNTQFPDPFVQARVRTENGYDIHSFPNKSPLFQGELATVGTAHLRLTRGNWELFESRSVLIKLFYSNGVEVKTIDLIKTLKYNDKSLSLDDFQP